MTTWQEYLYQEGHVPEWPYPLRYEQEQEIETDVLIIGGGIAGCWAAISAARQGVRVTLVEKGDTVRSGAGGTGCDHWCDVPLNPLSKVDPDQWAQKLASHPFPNGIGYQIQCRENYDTLLEMEQMGGKIRDTENKYAGVEGRDDATKFMISPRYSPNHSTNVVIRIWGTTFKPALKKECQRLGVKIYDRVMVTSLLTEKGLQGSRVVGATGFNNRTGEFLVFKSKASILSTAGIWALWVFNTELSGYTTFRSRTMTGDGVAMAFRAGAELTMMENSRNLNLGTGHKHTWYAGAGDASYECVQLVDDNGKKLPVPPQGWNDGGLPSASRDVWQTVRAGVQKGEYALPFYGDFPGMPEIERETTWNMMLREEATSRIIVDTYGKSGFDPSRDQLQNYKLMEGTSPAQFRESRFGGPVVDWNLKTSLEGLFAAGEQLFSHRDHSFCAATGRYAGRKAADYIKQVSEPVISREQVAKEKARIYAPTKSKSGLEWKELHAGIARTMQYFCSEFKTEKLLSLGLEGLRDIESNWVPRLYALDPHKLMRSLEDTSLLTYAQIVLQASLARKASNTFLEFNRIDYPQLDPPEWNKFITLKQENNKTIVGLLPFDYFGNMKQNYESHNRDYSGVYKK